MSLDKCKKCGEIVDTDNEPKAYSFETPACNTIELEWALCSWCKQAIYNNAIGVGEWDIKRAIYELMD